MSNEFELPEVFDPSQYVGTTDLVPIPPGWQSAQIVEASRKEALSNSSSTYVLAIFEIIEGAIPAMPDESPYSRRSHCRRVRRYRLEWPQLRAGRQ